MVALAQALVGPGLVALAELELAAVWVLVSAWANQGNRCRGHKRRSNLCCKDLDPQNQGNHHTLTHLPT
jgi:hypothetical protein